MSSSNQEDVRQRMAYHEAGHAVIAHHLAEYPLEVSIKAESGLGAYCITPPIQVDRCKARMPEEVVRLERAIQLLWAGHLAEERFTGSQNVVGACYDYDKITLLVALVRDTPDDCESCEEQLRIQTFHMLQRPDVWRAVESVAAALLEQSSLFGEDVRQLYLAATQEGR
jgi:hypothetical protein